MAMRVRGSIWLDGGYDRPLNDVEKIEVTFDNVIEWVCSNCGAQVEECKGRSGEFCHRNGVTSCLEVAPERVSFSWCNNASIVLDETDDTVAVRISVGDPRGAFVFMVRRGSDGRLILTVPYDGMTDAHMPLRSVGPGAFQVQDFTERG